MENYEVLENVEEVEFEDFDEDLEEVELVETSNGCLKKGAVVVAVTGLVAAGGVVLYKKAIKPNIGKIWPFKKKAKDDDFIDDIIDAEFEEVEEPEQ